MFENGIRQLRKTYFHIACGDDPSLIKPGVTNCGEASPTRNDAWKK
jgi:hypothetical protein